MSLQQISPILWTKNLKETTSFYEDVLGFASRSNYPNFVSLSRNDVQIMFILPVDEPDDCKEPDKKEEILPEPHLTGSLYIMVDNVDEIWESIQGKARIKTAIDDRHYWMRDFSIFDNNGYEIVFGQDISNKK